MSNPNNYSGFNPGQQKAILSHADKDILIAAGAGSGKTKVLSERVFRLMDEKEIKPSELLVLTFTNNAAHEMKTRIVSLFKKQGSSLSDEMISAHIQTFDSFSQYLVSTYSGRLGIASTIGIADETIIEAKRCEILDSIYDEWFNDPTKHKRLVSTARKLNVRGVSELTKIIIDLDAQFSKMMENNKNKFIDEYDDTYFTKESFLSLLDYYIDSFKEEMVKAIYQSGFNKVNADLLSKPIDNKDEINELFEDKAFFEQGYERFDFSAYPRLQNLYIAVLKHLKEERGDFIKSSRQFFDNADPLLAPSQKNWKTANKEENDKVKAMFAPLRILYATQEAILHPIQMLSDDVDELYEDYLSTKEDVHVLLEITKEMEDRLFEYEKSINSFTFSDISSLALRLVLNPEYEDVAEEIRQRFKYIMVDEYQDTNDFQEAFINSLLKPDKNGKRAHVFCVGDAKQSIYGFRNSNVELFRARQKLYEHSPDGEVIAMKTNYRSGKQLLIEINEIFKKYMSEEHGSIDYTNDMEQLNYDDKVNLYGDPYDGFHIYRIHGESIRTAEDEIKAIIMDIKDKIAKGYLVYDKGVGTRPCQYGDFAILTRTKTKYDLYQAYFNEANIPLNLKVDTNLREIDSIIVIESLLRLYQYIKTGQGDLPHYFASIARSYLYSYDDDKLHLILKDETQEKIKEDKIYQDMEKFVEDSKGESLSSFFLSLIERFGVIAKLHLVGSVNDANSKIESLYTYVVAKENAGEDLNSFIELFSNISKYDLGFLASSDFEVDNSVDLMTIHASKGLERKIVYLPSTQNHMSKGNAMKKPSYGFSSKTGIVLPRFYPNFDENGEVVDTLMKNVPYRAYELHSSDQEEINEHVRLFYVALTRAENSLVIVGEPTKSKEDLYDMLDYMPHSEVFNENFVNALVDKGVMIGPYIREYNELRNDKATSSDPLTRADFSSSRAYKIYKSLLDQYWTDVIDDKMEELKANIFIEAYQFYLPMFESDNPDFFASFYAAYLGLPFYDKVASVSSFVKEYNGYFEDQYKKAVKEIEDREKAKEFTKEQAEEEKKYLVKPEKLTPEKAQTAIVVFAANFLSKNLAFFGLKRPTKEDIKNKVDGFVTDRNMAYCFVPVLAKLFEGEDWVCKVSYASSSYPDFEYEINVDNYAPDFKSKSAPPIEEAKGRINDDVIEFKKRESFRASKRQLGDIDNSVREYFDFGERLHRYMELVDFKTKDLSFISNSKEKALIQRALNSNLISSLEGYEFKKEYGYYDEDLKTTGFIDLLAIKDGNYVIVDFKTKNILDEAYDKQLHTYQRNVMRLFNVDKSKIKLYLLSLIGTDDREVAVE
ncbi:MAG: UvrD-helicase domain-containing protein [Bacilli bacterium]|nr:UvrD-helicase domain-containing protein [Bacilli bacterium]